jgi:hypothetical protein
MTAAISRFFLLATLPLAASTVEFGTLRITQLANNNTTLSSASPGIAITLGPGGSTGGNFQTGANRGDYDFDFGQPADTATGVLISSVAQLSRDDSATGGPAPGVFHATSSLGFSTSTSKYWIAVHWAEAADSIEVNHDVSYAYLPYDRFPGGMATNTANNDNTTHNANTIAQVKALAGARHAEGPDRAESARGGGAAAHRG